MSLLPALACLVCPACLTTYAKALGTVGIGVVMSETQHIAFLAVAVVVALASSVHSLRLNRHLGPFAATAAGCTVLVAEHAVGGSHLLAALGIAALVLGGAWNHRLRRARAAIAAA